MPHTTTTTSGLKTEGDWKQRNKRKKGRGRAKVNVTDKIFVPADNISDLAQWNSDDDEDGYYYGEEEVPQKVVEEVKNRRPIDTKSAGALNRSSENVLSYSGAFPKMNHEVSHFRPTVYH